MWISKEYRITISNNNNNSSNSSSSRNSNSQISMQAQTNPSNQWLSTWVEVETWVWDNNSHQITLVTICSFNSSSSNQLWVDLGTFNSHNKTKTNLVVSNKLHSRHHLVGSKLNNKPNHSNNNSVGSISHPKIHSETFRVLQTIHKL